MSDKGIDPSADPLTRVQMAYVMLTHGTEEQAKEAIAFFTGMGVNFKGVVEVDEIPDTLPVHFPQVNQLETFEPKHKRGDRLWITGTERSISNIGKRVELLSWIPAKENYVTRGAGVCFGGGTGSWLVKEVDNNKTLIQVWEDGTIMLDSYCLCLDGWLSHNKPVVEMYKPGIVVTS